MKFFILLLIIFAVLIAFNNLNKYRLKSKKNNNPEDKTIDLEKDPKTDEYKPKE